MTAPQYLHAPIILLKEGVDTSQGRPQIISNINACQSIVDIVRTTLGPRGMDKLINNDGQVTITNDGATVVDLLNIVHPAAKVLVDIAKSQDDEVGDGTTSVVLFAGEFLSEAKTFLEEGIAPQIIIKGFQKASQVSSANPLQAIAKIKDLEISLAEKSPECAQTSLNSKLVAGYQAIFSKMVVDAVMMISDSSDKSLIGIKKVTGGSVSESCLIDGVAFKKTFSYAGFEQQPKAFKNPKILLLNIELELKAEKENAEVRMDNPNCTHEPVNILVSLQDYQAIVDAEWKIINNKLEAIVATGAQVVLSRLPIGDLATQHFADHGLFCAGRVDESDLRRTSLATGGEVQTTVTKITPDVLGNVKHQIDYYNFANRHMWKIRRDTDRLRTAKSATIILRGGAQQFIDESERSLNDAIMIVRRAVKTNTIVGGGGAIEMELSRHLRDFSRSISGKQQLVINAFAKSLECIPRALAQNSGIDQVDILNKLRQAHYQNKPSTRWMGIDCVEGVLCDTVESFIWEPSIVKLHAIQAASEAACVVLSIDETIKNPKSNPDPQNDMPAAQGKPLSQFPHLFPGLRKQRGGRM